MEYVREKAHQYELLNNLHIWQRKVEIAEVIIIIHQIMYYIILSDDTTYISTDLVSIN